MLTVLKILALSLSFACLVQAQDAGVTGIVRDANGGAVAQADIALVNGDQVIVATGRSDAEGRFRFSHVPNSSYVVRATASGFSERRVALDLRKGSEVRNVEVNLEVRPVLQTVTVAAHVGLAEDAGSVPQRVNLIGEDAIQQRAKAVIAQMAQEETGLALQRTSTSMSDIYVRGLTGDKVPVFIDGFRYSNAVARGGVSTFFDLIDPQTVQMVEVVRGPSSAQYGSDALGGSVQYISRSPSFAADGANWHGQWSTFFDSADAGFGSAATMAYGRPKFGLLVTTTGHRHSTLRTGQGLDSHAAVTRFLGLPSTALDDARRSGTAFTQYGGMVRLNWAVSTNGQILVQYTRSQQDKGRRYDQLLGGDGNLIADLNNLKMDFFYWRFAQIKLGWLDSFSVGYAFGSQREERVNQGGNGNPLAAITHEPERTNANSINLSATKYWGARHTLLFGGDLAHERVKAPSFQTDAVTGAATLRRGRVPDNARYLNGGLYLQEVYAAVPGKVRFTANVRYNGISYKARSSDSPLIGGRPLWRDDALSVHGTTFRLGGVVTPIDGLSFMARVGRGFRPPLITDLGTLGLTGSGFEVAAPDVAGLGATIGSRADSLALSTSTAVQQLIPESSTSFDAGVHFRNRLVDAEFTWFVNDIRNVIVKQALILPSGAVGASIGGSLVTSQNASGAVFVAESTNPVLVRANFDEARQRGFEQRLNWKVSQEFSLGTVWTNIRARDNRTGLIPNIEGGTPGPDAYLKLRYAPAAHRFWVETYMHAVDRQERLSSLDLSDRRSGAERTRGSIQNFFRRGATVRGLVSPGLNGFFGDGDDVLIPTGETLAQVQDRVLGAGVNAAPLFTHVPGYFTVGVRGGISVAERHQILLDVENLTDRNYRGIFWGIDAPGRGVSGRYTFRF